MRRGEHLLDALLQFSQQQVHLFLSSAVVGMRHPNKESQVVVVVVIACLRFPLPHTQLLLLFFSLSFSQSLSQLPLNSLPSLSLSTPKRNGHCGKATYEGASQVNPIRLVWRR